MTAHTHIDTRVLPYIHVCIPCMHTRTHTPNKFVWKVTEVSHCHYTAHSCHFSVSHQYITQTKVCLHTHMLMQEETHTHTHCYHTKLTNAQNHFNTNRENAQPGSCKTRLCFYKTNCLFSSDEAPTAGANEYKHRYVGYKALCSYGVILASKTVSCIFSRERDTTSINMMCFKVNII